ncbi:MAG: hypothetical protein ACRDDZ_01370 [Marinifilaceae bacterium]
MNIEIQVDTTVIIDGIKYKCLEYGSDNDCDGCDLDDNSSCCGNINCASTDRTDKRSVIFKEIKHG